jgi:DNA recombination protein RmuC
MLRALNALTDSNAQKLDQLRQTIDERLEAQRQAVQQGLDRLRTENTEKLDQMRQTVDEKLQETLKSRLGEAFQAVSDNLDRVHKSMLEVQTLASGVGDLKRVLANVKTRGIWGEAHLGNLLGQLLPPEQFEANVDTAGTGDRVEFAIRMPGHGEDGVPYYLPIDAKFPMDVYEQISAAAEAGDAEAERVAVQILEQRVKAFAKDISSKYVSPPRTSDFAIMFLPTEGLYAEVLRRPGLADLIHRDFRIVVAGPTTLCAMLNSLQMGFRTLAVQRQSAEVWRVLGAVKTEFGQFGDVLARVRKQLESATKTIDAADVRKRSMERKLRTVESLPAGESQQLLGFDATGAGATDDADEESAAAEPVA